MEDGGWRRGGIQEKTSTASGWEMMKRVAGCGYHRSASNTQHFFKENTGQDDL